MEIVEFLVGTYGVHIGINAISRFDIVLGERESLPFSKRVHHLGLGIAKVFDGERHCTLHAVEIVVDTESLKHEQWCCHSAKTEFSREILLEELLYLLDAMLGLYHIEQGLVTLRFDKFTHVCLR